MVIRMCKNCKDCKMAKGSLYCARSLNDVKAGRRKGVIKLKPNNLCEYNLSEK